LSSDTRSVPDLTGLEPQEAFEKLSLRSLKLKVEKQRRYSDLYPEGRILAQEPKARKILVPSLIGMSMREAKLVAEQKGFKVRRSLDVYSERVAEGSVIAQSRSPRRPSSPSSSTCSKAGDRSRNK